MKVFIAGIMQGSRRDRFIDDQGYRGTIARAILAHHPEAEIVDPNELHPEGTDYDDETAQKTLLALLELAGGADLLVAYAPQASMGTAIEMWEAYRARAPVVTISPMTANWVVRYLSAVVLPDMHAFSAWVSEGGLTRLLAQTT
ncbi:MAG: hypothetical protein PVG11_06335 [Anaerolineae bacterium]|jgi:hypothetical protein